MYTYFKVLNKKAAQTQGAYKYIYRARAYKLGKNTATSASTTITRTTH